MKASSKNNFSFESHTHGSQEDHTTAGHPSRRLPSSQILKTLLLTALLLAGWGSRAVGQTELELTGSDSGAIPISALNEQHYQIDIRDNIRSQFPDKFANDDSGFMKSWSGKWYVTNPGGDVQPLATGQGVDNSWSEGVLVYNNWTLANNVITCNSSPNQWGGTDTSQGWFFNQRVGLLDVYAPNGKKLGDYVGYKVIFEVSDEYNASNPNADPKVRFILPIPTGVIFEYEGSINNTWSISQPLEAFESIGVTLDWTGSTASSAIAMPTIGWKYARFFVVDSNGDPVDPTDDAHKLTVSNSKACINKASGYYVYNSGNEISLPTVTLSSTTDVTQYKVVCWLTAVVSDIQTGDDGKVVKEPTITDEYTYSFTRPRGFLGSLKEGTGQEGRQTVIVQEFTSTEETVPLGDALTAYTKQFNSDSNHPALYARVWLTTTDGTLVDPTGKLTVNGLTAFTNSTDVKYGFYLASGEGISSLSDATLTLDARTFPQYEVHVAVSSDAPASTEGFSRSNAPLRAPAANEPDYDYVHTFDFAYDIITREFQLDELDGSETIFFIGENGEYHDMVLEDYNKTDEQMAQSQWYGRWYITSDGTDRMTVSIGNGAQNDQWVIAPRNENGNWNGNNWQPKQENGRTIEVYTSGGRNETWMSQQSLSNAKVFVPNGRSVSDYAGYKLVFEAAESYDGNGTPDFNLRYTFILPSPDAFINEPSSGVTRSGHEEQLERTAGVSAFSLSAVADAETGTKYTSTTANYVRIYVVGNNGKPVAYDYKSDGSHPLLNVTSSAGTVQKAGQYAKNGLYVYNNGNSMSLSDIHVTLHAGAGKLNRYKVIALLSDGTISELPQEPQWNHEYSYTIKYPIEERIVELSEDILTQSEVHLNYTNAVLSFFGLTSEEMSSAWYERWKVTDADDVVKTLEPKNATSGNWTLAHPNNGEWPSSDWTADGDWVSNLSTTVSNNKQWYLENFFAHGYVRVPDGSTYTNYQGYKIIYEVSPTNSADDIALRYIFLVPTLDPFVNKTDPVETLDKYVNVAEVASANGNIAIAESDLPADTHYLRFYLAKNGDAKMISETLSVSYDGVPATPCTAQKNGKYLSLANDFDVNKLSVSTSLAADELLKYQLVCVSSSHTPAEDKEPAWEHKTVWHFQKEISQRIYADDQASIPGVNIQSDILSRLDVSVSDFSGSLYAKWYVEGPSGTKQQVDGGNGSWDSNWRINIRNGGFGDWSKGENELRYYTGMSDNTTSANIESWGWRDEVARTEAFWVPKPSNDATTTSNYIGYRIVFEFSDEYDATSNGADPGYRLRYVYTITDPNAFTGELNDNGDEDGMTQEVSRTDASVTVDLTNGAFAHSKLSGKEVKYARFYLTDSQGNMVSPDGKLTVVYSGGTVTTCNVTEQGFYVYPANNDAIDLSKLSVTLAAPKAYKQYQVVGVFSTELDGMDPEDYSTPLMREPDWDLKYTYSFKYPAPTTKVISVTIPWSRHSMKVDASTTDEETDWGISFEELSVEQYVKWYVVDGNGNKQPLEHGSARKAGTWVVKSASDYTVDEEDNNMAVLTGLTDFTEANWNGVWSKPTFYAPAGKEYDDFSNYKFICEVAAEASAEATPYVRYEFSMEKSFFGELKDNGTEGGETIDDLEQDQETVTIPLSHALANSGISKAVYARVWLTKSDGTLVEPTGLSWVQNDAQDHNQAVPFSYHNSDWSKYGYYLCSADVPGWNSGITGLSDAATLTLTAGTFNQYQVHVALSSSNPTGTGYVAANNRQEFTAVGSGSSEPDYDYVYTFKFDYGFEAKNINTVKTKYKTVIYDETTRRFTPLLMQNWPEVAADCDVTRDALAEKGYVRWYLQDLEGNLIQIEELTSNEPYTSLNNPYGYYRYTFDPKKLTDAQRGLNDKDYNPTIVLPDGYNYNEVRLVAVVTTKTEPQAEPNEHLPVNIPAREPQELQAKYVYTLVPTSQFANRKFVHYQGEAYKYLMQMGMTDLAAERDYITVDGTAGTTEQSWDYEHQKVSEETFGNIRQNVHTVHYYVYFDKNDAQDKMLLLPSQYYTGGGNDTEPRAYYRWYDWQTDMKSANLSIKGSELHLYPNRPEVTVEDPSNPSRGYFAMLLNETGSMNPCDNNIGVRFNAPADWNSEITVACDVSRYLDGMDDSFTYLMHEPTLSVRYIYHIMPAEVIASAIAEAATVTIGEQTYHGLEAVEANLLDEDTKETRLYEYNGRTVVSLDGTTGRFSLRANLQNLNSYWVYSKDATSVENCGIMQWFAYYKDDTGLWKHEVNMEYDRGTSRIGLYKLNDENEKGLSGNYVNVTTGYTKTINIKAGDRVYMVGCLSSKYPTDYWTPVVWTELNFIDAKPLKLGTESGERTDQYMRSNYTLATVLDFNNFFLDEETRFSKPTGSYENYAKVPIIWPDAQYGFCYPQLYGLDGSTKFASWGVYGIAPTHGDYTLLKSMNMEAISQDVNFGNQSIGSQWWDTTALFDVTHERAVNGKDATNTNDYGTFLYVDASDEARVIAELEFDAALCDNAEIYYTAYVADITDGATKPQVRFRVSTMEGGERVPVVTFETGDIMDEGATTGYWHQVYGYTVLPNTNGMLNGAMRHYYVSVENICTNTNGADYTVDQISFYTHQAKVKAQITSDICDEGDVKLKIFAEADELIKSLKLHTENGQESKTVFYTIVERIDDLNHELHAEDILTGTNYYWEQVGEKYNNEYSVVSVPLTIPNEVTNETLPDGQLSGFFKKDGVVYYQFDERMFHLEPGKKYFVSFYNFEENRVGGLPGWGAPYAGNACSTYSNDVSPNRMHVELSVDGVIDDGRIDFACDPTAVTKTYDIAINYPVGDGYEKYTFFNYDFFYVPDGMTTQDFKLIKGEGEGGVPLETAIERLRQKTKDPIASSDGLPTDYDENYTEAMRILIKKYMDNDTVNGKLYLDAASKIERTFEKAGKFKYLALPLDKTIPTGGEVCSPIEFEFHVDAATGGPVIELGFDDVDYPDGYIRTIRVGLEQLSKMKASNYMLHIPISSYQNKGGKGMSGRIYFSNTVLNLVKTNDPTITTYYNDGAPTTTIKVGEIKLPEDVTSGQAYVGPDRMYLPVDFSECAITFHEGYWYEVSTQFYDEEDETLSAEDRCGGDLFFILKVVPEFATWEGQPIEENPDFLNANWYNDGNWKRSVRADLYKDANQEGKTQNTVTLGHPEGYDNNGEGTLSNMGTANPGFVPMKFTYVTLLSGRNAPSLIKEPKVTTSSAQQGGGLLDPNQTRMMTDPSPYTNQVSSVPTENIRYDMLVRYGAHSEGGEGCFGHRQMSMNASGKYIWGNDPREDMTSFNDRHKAFDVEKFYGNICKEIYFKPGAELLRQQRLSYNRAWVEKELVPNKWYLVSSPLKDTYAGDMYVPTTMSDHSMETSVAKPGRQMTEAFQPINFSTAAVNADAEHTVTSQPAYSRTKYPIYQRSWNTDGSKVYTKTNDARATDYSANLKYGEVTSVATEWSHTYNDVQVPYTRLTGFSIRANRKEQKIGSDDVPALIRLPKADTQYDYYQWDNTSPADGKVTHGVPRSTTPRENYPLPSRYTGGITDNYRFLVDDPIQDGIFTADIADLQQQDGYILVGNPYMASLRMDEFFKGNTGLAPSYWTYEGSVASAALAKPETITATGDDNADGIIRPLQAFFVKKKTELDEGEDEATAIVFTRNMTIDGNYPAVIESSPSRQFTLRAASAQGSSSAVLRLNDSAADDYQEGEDVETLFDSNLAQVPMVYTVAGGQAVSIDQRPQLDVVPFGVTCADSNDPVSVQFSGLQSLDSRLQASDGGSVLSPLSTLYVLDALTGEQTEVGEGSTVQVQPNDYGRYFLTTTSRIGESQPVEQSIVVSVRQRDVTVVATEPLTVVSATTLGGVSVYSERVADTKCTFRLSPGVYIVDARSQGGLQRRLKVIVN